MSTTSWFINIQYKDFFNEGAPKKERPDGNAICEIENVLVDSSIQQQYTSTHQPEPDQLFFFLS